MSTAIANQSASLSGDSPTVTVPPTTHDSLNPVSDNQRPAGPSGRLPASFANVITNSSLPTANNSIRTRFTFRSQPSGSTGGTHPRTVIVTPDHGIVIEASLYTFTNKDYLTTIKTAVGATQLHSYSRMQGIFQVYFTDKSFATQFITTGLDMPGNQHIPCHPVGVPPVRVVVSDVPSHFEPAFLRDIMSTYGRVVGPIKTLRASAVAEDLTHLLSFRRQVQFASSRARADLPDRIFVDYNDAPLTFFVSTDIRCYYCGHTGHVRDTCPHAGHATARAPHSSAPSAPAIPLHVATDQPPPPPRRQPPAPSVDLSPITVNTATESDYPPLTDQLQASLRQPSSTSTAFKRPGPFTADDASAKKIPLSDSDICRSKPQSIAPSDVSDVSDFEDSPMDCASSSPTPPLSRSSLASLFDAMYRSKLPILVHVRQHVTDIAALQAYLTTIRLDKDLYAASPLTNLTPQVIYQWQRKIAKELKAEQIRMSS